MHELSLVRLMDRSIREELSPEEMEQLVRIDLEVGPLANVEPVLLLNAFEAVQKAEGLFKGVQLHIKTVPIQVQCLQCQAVTTIEDYRFVCGRCNTPCRNIIRGMEFVVKRLYFNDPVPHTPQKTASE